MHASDARSGTLFSPPRNVLTAGMNDLLPYGNRFASGVVRRVYPLHIDIELDRAVLGVRQVRVSQEHWPGGRANAQWETGERIESLFIYDLSTALRRLAERGDASHGFASIVWADPARNPWNPAHPDHPRKDRIVSGEVFQHAGDSSAIVRLDGQLLEAFLHLRNVPQGRFETLASLLPPGLELTAVVVDVDTMRCKLELSVLQWLENIERSQGHGRHPAGARPSPATPYVQFVDPLSGRLPVPPEPPGGPDQANAEMAGRWRGKGVIVVDDDKEFRRNLVGWLKTFGATAWDSDNAHHTSQLLDQHAASVTHVLVDFHLGSSETVNSILRLLLRRAGTHRIAVISGIIDQETTDGMQRLRQLKGLKDQDLALIAKPLHFQVVDEWLLKGHAPEVDIRLFVPAAQWAHDRGPVAQDIRLRGERWLEALCKHSGALAGLWVRCHQPGHDIVAMHRVLVNEPAQSQAQTLHCVVSQMRQSLVADAESTRRKAIDDRGDSGTLARLCPSGATQITAWPLLERDLAGNAPLDQQINDVLLLFSSARIDDSVFDGEPWTALLDWGADLTELERHQDRLLEDATFATVGRVHAATLHEMRSLLQVFQNTKPWDPDKAVAWWDSGQRLSRFVDGGLYNTRPERIAQVNLGQRLEALMSDHVWQFAARRSVTVIVFLPPADLIVTLPPEVFEQPLINLVDNATKSCQQRRRWAWVEVRVKVSNRDPRSPLILQVRDCGQGMTPQERRHLFKPRHTKEGIGRFGMGLYVSQRLARAAGGDLILQQNRRWGGCTFELCLPLAWGSATLVRGGT